MFKSSQYRFFEAEDEHVNWQLFDACAGDGSDDNYREAVDLISNNNVDINAVWSASRQEWIPSQDVTSVDKHDETALFAACKGNNYRLAMLLLKAGATDGRALLAVLHYGCRNMIEVVALMVERGFDVNQRVAVFWHPRPRTPLWEAAWSGFVDVARLLIEKGAVADDSLCPPLSATLPFAPHGRAAAMARLLLVHGADPNARDGDSSTLGLAVMNGNLDLVQVLLEAGADPNAPHWRSSPLLFTVYSSSDLAGDIAALLLRYGADPNARDEYGRTLIRRAVRLRKSRVVEALLEHEKQRLAGLEEYHGEDEDGWDHDDDDEEEEEGLEEDKAADESPKEEEEDPPLSDSFRSRFFACAIL